MKKCFLGLVFSLWMMQIEANYEIINSTDHTIIVCLMFPDDPGWPDNRRCVGLRGGDTETIRGLPSMNNQWSNLWAGASLDAVGDQATQTRPEKFVLGQERKYRVTNRSNNRVQLWPQIERIQ